MEPEEWLAGYRTKLADVRARTEQAQRALAEVEATATSRDGAISVTVGPAGALTALVLGERSESMSRTQLAAAVLGAARRAQAEAARMAAAAVAPVIGQDSEAMRVIEAQLAVPR
ncbi:YbaB/EbfC family nucleoid-associated protein [Pseudonocardia sp. TRM90224]|uniref:YbaB/EbfC family nucleoid-associated protein n=1 Tax=Pseudonocardia sp. TRM90224 TaxID=2812678 RepID=UPI001E290137|nr:YbaB/EbfC family nucleoid-associated protein [Pseudonocardia sp. TRM90224]